MALGLPEVEAGPSCNKTAYKAGKKNFLFVGEKDGGFNVMLKVVESLGEVEKVAKASGGRLPVGSNGWVSAEYENGDDVPVVESYRVLVPKRLVKLMGEEGGMESEGEIDCRWSAGASRAPSGRRHQEGMGSGGFTTGYLLVPLRGEEGGLALG